MTTNPDPLSSLNEPPIDESPIDLTPPTDLTPEARAEWHRMAREIGPGVDPEKLSSYARAWSRYQRAEAAIKGAEIVRNPNGFPVKNPYLDVSDKALAQMTKIAGELRKEASPRGAFSVRRTATAAQIADIFDVTPRTVANWAASKCPHSIGARGQRLFDEAEVAAWMKETGKTGEPGRPTTPDDDEFRAIKMRKEAAMAKLHETRLEIMQGRYVLAEDVERLLIGNISRAKHHLLSIPGRVSSQLAGQAPDEIERRLTEEIHAALLNLSRPREDDDADDANEIESAPPDQVAVPAPLSAPAAS